jgi:hypothetical protein
VGIVEGVGENRVGVSAWGKGALRFALGMYGGALPRTPASFTLSVARCAGPGVIFGTCCGMELNWWASRWLSASR